MSQAVRLQAMHSESFIDKDHSFEILTMIAIPHTTICGRRLSKEPGIKKSKMISICCSALFQELSTFSLYIPIQYRSSDFGKFI
jgi:hypothetical protein